MMVMIWFVFGMGIILIKTCFEFPWCITCFDICVYYLHSKSDDEMTLDLFKFSYGKTMSLMFLLLSRKKDINSNV